VSNPGVQGRVGSLAFAPIAAVGWFFLALLGLAVRVALFPRLRSEGAVSLLWGSGFALFLWFGLWTLKFPELNTILFALVAGLAIALFVYLRGAGLEGPPLEQPGVFYRRLLAARRAPRASARPAPPPDGGTTRELRQARVALVHGELESALAFLREAESVASAQRKLDELLEVRKLVPTVTARSTGRTLAGSRRLERKIRESLRSFPPAELAAAGVQEEPDGVRPEAPLSSEETSEIAGARAALDDDDAATALFLLQEARRVAVAQGRRAELAEIRQLVEALVQRSDGRTRASGERLARLLEADLSGR